MNILILIKQVPDDSVKVTLGEDGKPALDKIAPVVNAFDTYALEMAARLKESLGDGAEITAVCVGTASAKDALKNCMAVGADYAYLVDNTEREDADAMETSGILAAAVRKLQKERGTFDLIFAGKEATDRTLGQTGIYLAEKLNIPVITNILEILPENGKITVKQETEEGFRKIETTLPALVTVAKPVYSPRYPTIKNKMAARRKPIGEYSGKELAGGEEPKFRVIREYAPPVRNAGIKIQEDTPEETAAKAVKIMEDARVL